MISIDARTCPICGSMPRTTAFPYATSFGKESFRYLKCGKCRSVFVDPVPNAQIFSLMYAKSSYHDLHYFDEDSVADYATSARLLRRYLKSGATVLDYGCGVGGFLKACVAEDLVPFGVEFDEAAARFAAERTLCEAISVDDFNTLAEGRRFDAIHLGDVLEHLPDPVNTLRYLLGFLKPHGVLFVEGPLEVNPSPVFLAARIFGAIKHALRPAFMPDHPPTHLFRTNAVAQKAFFNRVCGGLRMEFWQVYETGWPYIRAGLLKYVIARIAVLVGGRRFFGATLGNRFKAILIAPRDELS